MTSRKKNIDAQLEQIAKRYLRIETLETRNMDALDFHACGVWDIKAALMAAYELGQKEANV